MATGIGDALSEAGNGLGNFLNALKFPLGGFLIQILITAGVIVGLITGILFAFHLWMKRF